MEITPVNQQESKSLNTINGELANEDELEVANILINLPSSFKKSLSSNLFDYNWCKKRKRSCLVSQTPNKMVDSDAVAVNIKKEETLSRNTPLSHSVALNLSDSGLNHSSTPSSNRKTSRLNKKTEKLKEIKRKRVDEGQQREVLTNLRKKRIRTDTVNDLVHAVPWASMENHHHQPLVINQRGLQIYQLDLNYPPRMDFHQRRVMAAAARKYRIQKIKEKRTRGKFWLVFLTIFFLLPKVLI